MRQSAWLMRVLAAIFAALPSVSWAYETLSIPPAPIPNAPNARPAPEPMRAKLYLPKGSAPAPVIIVLHTCAGISDGELVGQWADRVNDWGYAALVLDSFTARGLSNVCSKNDPRNATPFDRSVDVINAAMVLTQTPSVDGSRIGVVGMSHGGSTAVTVTRRVFNAVRPGLIKAAVDMYGGCAAPEFHGQTPLLVLAGDADNWGYPAKSCLEFQSKLPPGAVMEVHTFPGVYHAFDNPILGRVVTFEGHAMKYDHDAAKESFALTRAFFDRYVRDAK